MYMYAWLEHVPCVWWSRCELSVLRWHCYGDAFCHVSSLTYMNKSSNEFASNAPNNSEGVKLIQGTRYSCKTCKREQVRKWNYTNVNLFGVHMLVLYLAQKKVRQVLHAPCASRLDLLFSYVVYTLVMFDLLHTLIGWCTRTWHHRRYQILFDFYLCFLLAV